MNALRDNHCHVCQIHEQCSRAPTHRVKKNTYDAILSGGELDSVRRKLNEGWSVNEIANKLLTKYSENGLNNNPLSSKIATIRDAENMSSTNYLVRRYKSTFE